MSTDELFMRTLLRPAVLHILRAAGFHGSKPSVVDTMIDITVRYMYTIAERTAYNAYSNHNDLIPDVTDVRMAMQDCGALVPTMTGTEEMWKEILRKPLEEYDEETGARAKEEQRRLLEDTADVIEFIDWVRGDYNKEIERIAGVAKVVQSQTEALDQVEMEDYLTTLMKKHSKTGVESRFQGTILGQPLDPKPIKIEGGPVDSIREWCQRTSEKAAEQAAKAAKEKPELSSHISRSREPSERPNGVSRAVSEDIKTESSLEASPDPPQDETEDIAMASQ